MIGDIRPKDVKVVIEYLHRYLYKRTEDYFVDQFKQIAVENQAIKGSILMSFSFGGKLYRYENGVIRFPQTLHESLYPKMHELVKRHKEIVEIDGAYAMAAIKAAMSRCETVSHLYQLLPEILHPCLKEMGIEQELDGDCYVALSDDQVNEFKTKHAENLGKIRERATQNLLGIIK